VNEVVEAVQKRSAALRRFLIENDTH
jgi:hypothetical protein